MPKDQVRSHYETVIETYLTTYVPEEKGNAKMYMEKSKHTDKKPHKLFYQILKKFSQGITHIGQRKDRKNVPGYDEL